MKEKRKKTYSLVKTTLLIVTLFSVLSCKIHNSSNELEQSFSQNQIEDLNKINDFFIEEVLKSNRKNFKQSLKEILEITHSYGIDTLLNTVSYPKQKELYLNISKQTFDEIWEIRINTFEDFKGEEYIIPKYNGKFQEFLKNVSINNAFVEENYKRMMETGDFYMLHFDNSLITKFNEIDFNDINNQLIISIYYLSMIDDKERDENRKKRRLEEQKKIEEQFNSDY